MSTNERKTSQQPSKTEFSLRPSSLWQYMSSEHPKPVIDIHAPYDTRPPIQPTQRSINATIDRSQFRLKPHLVQKRDGTIVDVNLPYSAANQTDEYLYREHAPPVWWRDWEQGRFQEARLAWLIDSLPMHLRLSEQERIGMWKFG